MTAAKGVAAACALLATLAPGARAAVEPKVVSPAPGETIEIVEGQPFSLAPTFDQEAREVRYSISGGPTIQTDLFPPFGEYISTRRFRRIGVLTDTDYSLIVDLIDFGGRVITTNTYGLLVHPVPVIPEVQVQSLILAGCTCLVGLKLLSIDTEDRVKAWGVGFGRPGSRFPFRLRQTASTPSTRTYLIPGGRSWGRGTHPQITVSIAPPSGSQLYGVDVRGRVFTARLMTDRAGDTSFRQTDRGSRCSTELSHDNRPPRRASCDLY
jgi:hypothetical protein